MEIRFTHHAQRQLQERNISESDAIETVLNPANTIKQSPQRFRAIRKIHTYSKIYLLVVIYDVRNTHKEIITAFLTSKLKKYL